MVEKRLGQGIAIPGEIKNLSLALNYAGMKPLAVRKLIGRHFGIAFSESLIRVWRRNTPPERVEKWKKLVGYMASLSPEDLKLLLDKYRLYFSLEEQYPHLPAADIEYLWSTYGVPIMEMNNLGDSDKWFENQIQDMAAKMDAVAAEYRARGETPPAFSEKLDYKKNHFKHILTWLAKEFDAEVVTQGLAEWLEERKKG